MSYAPFLAAAFVLWPLMGVLGGQGYAPLLVLAALPALFLARPNRRPGVFILIVVAFLIWTTLAETWSPASHGLITGSVMDGDFAVKSPALRMVVIAAFGALAFAGAIRIAEGGAQTSARVMLGGFAVQGLILFLSAVFAGQLLHLIYGDDPVRQGEGVQNVSRNANAFALALPVLAAYLLTRASLLWKLAALGLAVLSAYCFTLADTQAAMFGAGAMLAAFVFLFLVPRHGLRWMLWMMAAYIASAPFLIGAVLSGLERMGVSLPASFQSRAWSWEVVIGKIREAPLKGHGIEASKTWRETYADYPDWLAQVPEFWSAYPVVPGHPHNMALQLWAETGGTGAGLAALGLLVLGSRMPAGDAMRADIRYAFGGLIAVTACLFSFSYSLWNEAFWATVILAVCAVVLLSKRTRGSL